MKRATFLTTIWSSDRIFPPCVDNYEPFSQMRKLKSRPLVLRLSSEVRFRTKLSTTGFWKLSYHICHRSHLRRLARRLASRLPLALLHRRPFLARGRGLPAVARYHSTRKSPLPTLIVGLIRKRSTASSICWLLKNSAKL